MYQMSSIKKLSMKKFYGARIKQIREALGMTQSDFAETFNTSRQFLNNVEGDRATFSDVKLIELQDRHNVNLNFVLNNIGQMFLDKNTNDIVKIKLKKGQLLKIEYEE